MLSRAEIMDWVPALMLPPLAHPVCIEAALATMDVLEREAIHQRGSGGRPYHEAHQPLGEDTQHVGDVRGRGLMIGVEIVKDKKTKAPAHDERSAS